DLWLLAAGARQAAPVTPSVAPAGGRPRPPFYTPAGRPPSPGFAFPSFFPFAPLPPRRSGLPFLADISLFSLNFVGAAGQRECSQQNDSHRQRAHAKTSGARGG